MIILTISDKAVVGFNRPRIEQLLAARGNGKLISFGLSIADAEKMAQKSGAVAVAGAFIGKVSPSLYGAKAGLKPGDIVTALNDKSVRNADDLEKSLASLVAGHRVTITFVRDGATRQAEVLI